MPRPFVAIVAAAALAVGVALFARADSEPAGPRWEYRLLSWSPEQTVAALREVTGDEFGSAADMLERIVEGGEVAAEDPALRAAVDRRLAASLTTAGEEGWEAFWVREGRARLAGHPVPSPSVLLKRRR